jgi:ribosomal protein S18 acetylase RimI-like enzyme
MGLDSSALEFVVNLAQAGSCSRIGIDVVSTNESAMGFWEQKGFSQVCRDESYKYSGPVVVMVRQLPCKKNEPR